MIDLARLQPEVRPFVEAAAIAIRHTEPRFIGLIAYRTALKGGSIPRCSDIDLQVYLAALRAAEQRWQLNSATA